MAHSRSLAFAVTFASLLACSVCVTVSSAGDGQQTQPLAYTADTNPGMVSLANFGINVKGPWSELSVKHPNLALALELGIFFKAVEEFKQEFGNVFEGHDGFAEGVIENKVNYLPPRDEYFIGVSDGNFYVADSDVLSKEKVCHKLYMAGTNKYELVEAGAGAPFLYDGQLVEDGLVGPEVVRRVMEDANSEGLNFIRFNAFAVDNEFSVIVGADPIATNEAMLKGLDYILDVAHLNQMRVILVLTDYMSDRAGGPLQYLQLGDPVAYANAVNVDEAKALFYTSAGAQTLFVDYISLLANRVNTVNGRLYKNDPVIMAWDIINEPHCVNTTRCSDTTVSDFVSNVYNYLKNTLGVAQLVTVGTDGFYNDPTNTQSNVYPVSGGLNPFADAVNTGADFVALCKLVDFCEFNMYPDLWGQQNNAWIDAWVAGHSANGITWNKPVIVKEQGMQPTKDRTIFYAAMYSSDFAQIVADRTQSGGLKGAAYWEIFARGTKAVSWTLADGGRWGIYRDDPAVRYIERFSNRMAELRGNVGQCPAGINTTPLVLPQPKCKLGFEGPDCTDLNECVRGNSLCDRNAACINTEGGFTCQCYEGYIGNGKKCVPNLVALARTRESYYTNNTLSCFAGVVPVAYPVGAPGWVYDPTGYYNNPALINKNRIAVTLNECKMACSTANSCTSFYYDTAYSTCLLYTNSCPYTDSSVPGCAGPCDTNPCGSPLVESCTYPDYSNTPPAEPTLITNPNCGVGVTYFLKGAPLPAGCGPNPVR